MVGSEVDFAWQDTDPMKRVLNIKETNRDRSHARLGAFAGQQGEIVNLTVKVLGNLSSDDTAIRMSIRAGLLSGLGLLVQDIHESAEERRQTELISIVRTVAATLLSVVARAGVSFLSPLRVGAPCRFSPQRRPVHSHISFSHTHARGALAMSRHPSSDCCRKCPHPTPFKQPNEQAKVCGNS